eukprot:6471646-Amphidinium_carterae.1
MQADKRWAKALGWGSPFRAVGEHIVPVSQHRVAQAHDIDIQDGSNGLPLFKHLEEVFSKGNLSIQPTGELGKDDSVEFQVFVCSCIRTTALLYKPHGHEALPRKVEQDNKVWDSVSRRRITFGDLHQRTFSMKPWPSMRSMYLKADMAFHHGDAGQGCGACENREIPDPSTADNFKHYVAVCRRLRNLLTEGLQHVPPTEADFCAYMGSRSNCEELPAEMGSNRQPLKRANAASSEAPVAKQCKR